MAEEIWRGRQWMVTTVGIEEICDDAPNDQIYCIEVDCSGCPGNPEAGWPMHLAEKPWADFEEFLKTYLIACVYHRIEQANIGAIIMAGEERLKLVCP